MATYLFIQGMDNVEVEESYNLVRQRINRAITGIDKSGETLEPKNAAKPLHDLSFKTADGGRIAVNPDKIIGVGSDEDRDSGGEDE